MKKRISLLLLVLCMAVCLCACGGNSDQPQTAEPTTTSATEQITTTTQAPVTAKFEVTVVDQNGTPVQGVMMQICKDTCVPKMTDANGIAAFDMEITDGYKLSVLSCPTGYSYDGEAEIYLESGSTSYTVEIKSEA